MKILHPSTMVLLALTKLGKGTQPSEINEMKVWQVLDLLNAGMTDRNHMIHSHRFNVFGLDGQGLSLIQNGKGEAIDLVQDALPTPPLVIPPDYGITLH